MHGVSKDDLYSDRLYRRTGARPISALTRHIEREVAARLESADDVDRNELYRVLDGAKTTLGLSASALETLKHLIGYTRPTDYKGSARPIAWPSNHTLAELAGVTEGAIKARCASSASSRS